ncbi:MAG TPA: ABC transporter permease [Herpetosiphonaceae bacterium]
MALANAQVEVAEAKKDDYERPWLNIIKRFMRHRLALISLFVVVAIILLVIVAPLVAPYTQEAQNLEIINQAPTSAHIFGTDELGRDTFSRLLFAGRVSLYIAFAVTILSETLGVVLGVTSGYFGGIVDAVIMRTVDFLNTLPLLPFLLVITTILKPSINLLILILVFFGWTGGARLMRGQILSLREQEFVHASKALGASNMRVMFRHLVPNAIAPTIVSASLGLSGVMLTEAALSFLGFGVQLPAASWGNMLRDAGGLAVLENYPWRAFFPGLAIFICSLCFNFIGDGLRDALDPRMKR